MVFTERNNRIISFFVVAALILCLFCTNKVTGISGVASSSTTGTSFQRVSSSAGDIEAIKQSDSTGSQSAFVRKSKGNNNTRVRRSQKNMHFEAVTFISMLLLLFLFSIISEPLSQARKITIDYIHNKDGSK